MPFSKKKSKKTRGTKYTRVKNNAKKKAAKAEAVKADERDEAENQLSSPSREKDGKIFIIFIIGLPTQERIYVSETNNNY